MGPKGGSNCLHSFCFKPPTSLHLLHPFFAVSQGHMNKKSKHNIVIAFLAYKVLA